MFTNSFFAMNFIEKKKKKTNVEDRFVQHARGFLPLVFKIDTNNCSIIDKISMKH